MMNLLCDRSLLIGHRDSRRTIDSKIVKEAIEDFAYLQPRKSGIFRPVFNLLKSHYAIIGILLLFLGGLGLFSLLPRDSSLSVLKGMVNLLSSMEHPWGIGGNILPSEEQPIKIKGKIPPLEKRSQPEKNPVAAKTKRI